jgi:hypothetical protein
MPLTDTAIRNAKSGEKPLKLADQKGLYLLIGPAGGKWWRLDYWFSGKRKTLSMGTYPEVSLKEAGAKRDGARRQLAHGTDPGEHGKPVRRATEAKLNNSFESVAREWLQNVRHQWTLDHHNCTVRRFEAYVFPDIGHMPISDIEAPLLITMARKIQARGTVEMA